MLDTQVCIYLRHGPRYWCWLLQLVNEHCHIVVVVSAGNDDSSVSFQFCTLVTYVQ